ncbi:MAG: CoA pyrophosphatase [Prolixibacteraceae bacterium]|nr:CoA pyrophosphatase [Prolixibacteraceae bacterium]
MLSCIKNIDAVAITEALQYPLPGAAAQRLMLPGGRDLIVAQEESGYFRSAVLLLLYPENGELFFCLTKRNEGLKHHPGQISFPGGRCENHENDGWLTALRETEEEIGVSKAQVEYLGKLTDVYVTVSRFNIHPFLGYVKKKPDFVINHHEVDTLITLPLSSIFQPENHAIQTFHTLNGLIEAPCYNIQHQVIWGATSMMLAELEAILRQHCSRRAAR